MMPTLIFQSATHPLESRHDANEPAPLPIIEQSRLNHNSSFMKNRLILLLLAAVPLVVRPAFGAIAQQAYLKASNTHGFSFFGAESTVAISGDTVVVGALGEWSNATGVNGNQNDRSASSAGAAYVFVRNGTNWVQQAYLKASNAEAPDLFGTSVAISGNTVVVAARGESSSASGVNGDQTDNSADRAGAVYVFVRQGTSWTQQAYLKASNAGARDSFGWSVAISGDVLIVGAPFEQSSATGINGDQTDDSANEAGAAYIFVRDGTNWTQQAYLKASNAEGAPPGDPGSGDHFGWSVAVSGATAVVGAPLERSNATGVNGDQSDNSNPDSGAAYVFVQSGSNWSQQAYLKASNANDGSYGEFGWSVGVSGNTVVVGAFGEDSSATGVNGNQNNNSAPSSGAAYVFVREGDDWSQQAYLKASNTGVGDNFGYSIGISGEMLIVGAPNESSAATGVNGNQNNNSAYGSGAGYVFVREGGYWLQQAYLKASNTGEWDRFGEAVAISGGTVVVGAPQEDSRARGVNGNQNDNGAEGAGAAYVFTGVGLPPQLTIADDGSSGYFLRFTGAPAITYRLQRAPNVTGPWSDIATNTAPASGRIEYHEATPPPGAAFYRTVQP